MCSEAECIADMRLRKKIRLMYPGACSLEFQSLMQILIETLFNWDTKKQRAKGKGIFGTVVAFGGAASASKDIGYQIARLLMPHRFRPDGTVDLVRVFWPVWFWTSPSLELTKVNNIGNKYAQLQQTRCCYPEPT